MRFFISVLIVAFLGLFGGLLYYYNEIRHEADKVIDYRPDLTTRIYDRNGNLIANIFDKEHRIYAKYEEIPPRVIEALLAIEDTLFFEHNGINFDAIFRALIKDIKAMRLVEGASTLTQQLVKNTVLTREKKFSRKLKEVLLALKVETVLSKEEIIERYLNQIFFGHGYYGIKTAAYGYFRKELKDLTLKEAAMLVGLPRAPSYYDPTKNMEHALDRANRVLSRMHKLGWIDDATFAAALKEVPIVYNDTLTQNRAPYVTDEVVKRLSKELEDLKKGGYEIYTTIDLEYQDLAKEALGFGYENIIKRAKNSEQTDKLNGAMVVMENTTGDILALVGGVNYQESSFNRATQAKRQPGSSFKPFIYQAALNLGYSPATLIPDIARTYEFDNKDITKKWQPKNYEKDFKGLITLREALVHSRNLATINLVNEIGLVTIYKELKKFGFKDIPLDLSLSLGSMGMSPYEFAGFYSIISNYGKKVEPRLISKVLDRDKETVIEYEVESRELFEPKQAYLMIDILKDVVKRGTGRRAKVKGIELAGKTGTTNNNIDAWFCGFSPSIEVIVWYGKDDNKPMRRGEAGGVAAAPVFGYFFKKLLKKHPELKREFDIPDGVIFTKINGKKEVFTDISKPPAIQNSGQERLLF
ncbi:transglycosylase domain-containing protein [Nitrosophilus alvini]|uniref:transglycosylase domain-containing protein n=1 Tax=Nitrosophilus alvini TaxID=2714855 RepID=UPI00190CD909|nr:PBP1A family penicillin-binding protein [Nitrosophilus alvini]